MGSTGVLEAIEDYLRGWREGKSGLGDERVARGRLAIEHVMPRKWHTHWPLVDGRSEAERDRLVHTLGNLTLLTGKLNSKVSNAAWVGAGGEREGLEGHDVLLLNRDETIRARTQELTEIVIQIWPVPLNHRSQFIPETPRLRKKVVLSDLIGGGALHPGISLFPRRKKFSHEVATLLPDGRLEVDGTAFSGPTEAATAIVGKRTNGWGFFLVDQQSGRSPREVRREYIEAMAVDAAEEELDDEGGEDEV